MAIQIPSPTHSLLTALRISHSSSGFPSSTQYRNYRALAALHCTCNSSRGILRGQRPNFIASHLGVATMALSLFNFGRPNSLSNPFWLESAWSPFDLGDISPAGSFAEGARAVAGTKVDWLETDEAHVFKADLPGLKKEEVKVQLEDDRVLQISGERNQEEEKKGDKWHTVERSHGKFLRRFRLPDNAQADSVSAKVENGVLTVTVPKTQTKAPETRNIEVA